ncbi:MAG: ferredoxin [Acidimicrobiia bacterium]
MVTVWIDPTECMGAGTCEQLVPEVFVARTDGLWAVKEAGEFFGRERVFDGAQSPQGSDGRARVPEDLVEFVVDAAEQCPGECIYLEG